LGNFSALSVGMLLDMDAALQPDGSLVASRIAVEESTAVDMQTGPVLIVGGDPLTGETSTWVFNRLSQGQDRIPVVWPYDVHGAVFQISGQLRNQQMLPFVPAFDASNVVAGQNVYISAHGLHSTTSSYSLGTTVTLVPQTINGTVLGSSVSGNFTDYTISLASYDLFPTFAVQPGQKTLLTNPSQVEVYIDNKTQKLNTLALAPGNTLRFYGLVFDDNGTLRMDCVQVSDGVTATSQSMASDHSSVGQVRTFRRAGPGKLPQVTTIVTRSR
jgi:hypothetical protein